MAIVVNTTETLERVVGNVEAIGAQLKDITGTVVNLTGRTVTFRMVEISTGAVKVDDSSAALSVAATGKVQYNPSAGDMDTAGTYAMYFNDDLNRRWPYDGARFLLHLKTETND